MERKAGLFYVAHMLIRESYFIPLLSTAGGSTLKEVVTTTGAVFHNVNFYSNAKVTTEQYLS